jgi:hypothetical protein
MIRPEFWEDTKMAKLSIMARLFYIASWNFADDNGILPFDTDWLKTKIFPYDKIKGGISEFIDELLEQERYLIYEVNNKKYIYIVNFRRYQIISHPMPSDFPMPPELSHLGLGQGLTQSVRMEIYKRDEYTCQYCGENLKNQNKKISIDHVMPLSQNGTNLNDNLVTCCKRCNSKKKNRTPEQANMRLSNPKRYPDSTSGQHRVNATLSEVKLKEEKLKEDKEKLNIPEQKGAPALQDTSKPEIVPKTKPTTPQALFLEQFAEFYTTMTQRPFKADKHHFVLVANLLKKFKLEVLVEKTRILAKQCETSGIWFTKEGWADFKIETLSKHWNALIPVKTKEEKDSEDWQRIFKRQEAC